MSTLMWLDSVQIAFVAGNTYTFVEVLAAMLFLATQDQLSGGYSPSNSMVRRWTIQSLLTSSTSLLTGHCLCCSNCTCLVDYL